MTKPLWINGIMRWIRATFENKHWVFEEKFANVIFYHEWTRINTNFRSTTDEHRFLNRETHEILGHSTVKRQPNLTGGALACNQLTYQIPRPRAV